MNFVEKIYDEVVSRLSHDDQLRLVLLILNGLVNKMSAESNKVEEEAVPLTMTRSEYEQISALLEEVVGEMRNSNDRMAKDQEEIDRLQAKTKANLAEIKTILDTKF
ncbi:MAG: hypothetical protein JNM09_23560 [Blastocatellia bacterium]|nr:hypothetical protein [Blastocatellia bacterium]